MTEKSCAFESQVQTRRKIDERRRVSDVFPAVTHQMKERENTKKKTSSRASVVYISNSGECEERNPKRATPTADEIRAGYMQESIS